jgi:hypothetical protein
MSVYIKMAVWGLYGFRGWCHPLENNLKKGIALLN